MEYKKILIIGSIGSGKTTLGRKLSKIFKIKNYELDNIVYKRRDTYEKYPPKIRDKKTKKILKRKKWIIEGFHSRYWTYPIYRKADIVIILNIKPSISKRRVFIRFLKRRLSLKKTRKTNSKFTRTLKLLKFIEEYPKKYFKMQKETAKEYNKNVLILNTPKEVKKFLKELNES